MQETSIKPVDAPLTVLGEGPTWCAREECLYWIDIVGRRVLRLRHATGRVDTADLPYAPSAVIPRTEGGLLLITKKGMATLDFDTQELQSLPVPLVDFSREVFNDAKCDAAGRIWVGTRDLHGKDPNGSLFRLDPDMRMTRHTRGLVVSNGMDWSPDGCTFYHVETNPGRIDAYDFDVATGTLSNRRIFVDYAAKKPAIPDGCTMDAEGGLWVAELNDSHLRRYAPDGSLDRAIHLPLSKPTSVMFGGPHLETLYVTSMQFGLSPEELARQPLAGALLAVDVGVRGRPQSYFGT